MIKHKLIIFFSGTVLFFSGPALEAQPDPGSKLEEDHSDIFTMIADSSSKVMTIKSEFIQEKHLKMMEKVIISNGMFFFQKPDEYPAVFGQIQSEKVHGTAAFILQLADLVTGKDVFMSGVNCFHCAFRF